MDNFWPTGSILFKNKLEHLMNSVNMDAKLFIRPTSPVLQFGPTCGFAALATALNSNYSENIKLAELVELAKNDGITNFGELFSVNWLVEFVARHWPQNRTKIMDFPTPFCIIQRFMENAEFPASFLIPYDCDKNFEPCIKNGHSAHWAILIGFVLLEKPGKLSTNEENSSMNLTKFTKSDFKEINEMNFDENHFYLIAYQGKSRHPALWSYSSLRQSNAQLNVLNPTSSSNFRMPPEGMAAIRGKCCCLFVERVKGWKVVQKSLPRIIDYGRNEGILQVREYQRGNGISNMPGIVVAAQEGIEAQQASKENRSGDKVNLPTNDITLMHEAIPFLPFPIALVCLFLNIILPGSGTILSGISALCMGQPRVNFKEGRKLVTLFVNLLVGISQFFTITFLFVGWFWSIAWGGLIIIHAMQYREALQQRRQEAVATAAIEALTKDSILHRRDVKTLVKQHKDKGKEEKEKTKGVVDSGTTKLDTLDHNKMPNAV